MRTRADRVATRQLAMSACACMRQWRRDENTQAHSSVRHAAHVVFRAPVRCLLSVIRCVLRVVRCVLRVIRCVLRVVRCVLRVVRCVLRSARVDGRLPRLNLVPPNRRPDACAASACAATRRQHRAVRCNSAHRVATRCVAARAQRRSRGRVRPRAHARRWACRVLRGTAVGYSEHSAVRL